ncbi:hypothetical protein NL676_016488 [Syzygium grande]|nr:hypothetical protein NL676_016488 [Syzygium grande]
MGAITWRLLIGHRNLRPRAGDDMRRKGWDAGHVSTSDWPQVQDFTSLCSFPFRSPFSVTRGSWLRRWNRLLPYPRYSLIILLRVGSNFSFCMSLSIDKTQCQRRVPLD